MKTLQELLSFLTANEVKFQISDDKIRYKDPHQVIKDDVLLAIKTYKQDILRLYGKPQQAALQQHQAGQAIRVSPFQQSMLFSELLTSEHEYINLPLCLKFASSDAASSQPAPTQEHLLQALRQLITDEPALRLGYRWLDDQWLAQLNSFADNQVSSEELEHAEFLQLYGDVETYCNQHLAQKFVLDGSPLCRAKITQVFANGQASFVLVMLTVHHAVCDGIALSILCERLEALVSAQEQQQAPSLTKPTYHYIDYLNWPTATDYPAGLEFWQQSLRDAPQTLHLPMSQARPAQMSFAGKTLISPLATELVHAAEQYSKTAAVTPFAVYLAVFSALLRRYAFSTTLAAADSQDIVVGVPFANRVAEHTSDMVGLFMNTLPLRLKAQECVSLASTVQHSQQQLRQAANFQHISLVDIIHAVNPPRNASYAPLFQVMINYIDQSAQSGRFASAMQQPASEVAKYDLSLILVKHAQGMSVHLEYNSRLFSQSSMQLMSEHFTQLLRCALQNPQLELAQLDYRGEHEKQLLQTLNASERELPACLSPAQSLFQHCRERPTQTALIYRHQHYSYQQLRQKIDSIVVLLQEKGVGAGDVVGICLLRSPEMVAAMYACFALGASYVPLDPAYPAERIAQICADAKPRCVVSIGALASSTARLAGDFSLVRVDVLPEVSASQEAVAVNPEDTAYVIFTSGSTGRPKGIAISFGSLHNLLCSLDQTFSSEQRQLWLAQTSLNFDISIVELVWTLSRGHQIVLQQSRPFEVLKGGGVDSLQTLKPLNFSLMFFAADDKQQKHYDLFIRASQYADQQGFHAVWMPERHFADFGGAFASPVVLASYLAGTTSRLSIRSGSVVLPLHDPVRVAEEWAMIDQLSNGRVGLSVASGWHPNDFVFQGADFANRHQQLRDKVTQLKTLWSGQSIVRQNGLGKDVDVKTKPGPIQKHLPLWVTAAGHPDTFRYAGEIGANVLTHMLGQDLEKLAHNIGVYHQALAEHGHAIEGKTVSLMLHTFMHEDDAQARKIAEKPFKAYLASALKLLEPLAAEFGLDLSTQLDEIIDLAFERFTTSNTLIGSPQRCQVLLQRLQAIGVTEIASLIDFGVDEELVMTGLSSILQAKSLYQRQQSLTTLLDVDNYQTELQLVQQYQPSHLQMTPSQAKMLLQENRNQSAPTPITVTHWLLGGEALSKELLEELRPLTGCRFFNMYGPTETTVWSAWTELSGQTPVIAGLAANTRFALLDSRQQPVPVGVPGELMIAGKGLAIGYYGNPALTAEKFQVLACEGQREKYYATGDLMSLNLDGTLQYIGRIDNQVKINGYRIEPEEVEQVIRRLPQVADCKVLSVRDSAAQNSASLKAYVVKQSIVHGTYTDMPAEQQAKPFHFADGSIIYHHTDRQLALLYQEIFADETYFKHDIAIAERGLVLDVGANVGTFSIDASRRQPSAAVIAFEPIPRTFSALKKNFEYRNIRGLVVNMGASDKPENVVFSYYPEMAGMSGRFSDRASEVAAAEQFIAQRSEATGLSKDDPVFQQQLHDYLSVLYRSESVECRLTTISDVIDELQIGAIDLLKIDVEKSECLVLNGIREEHWQRVRQMVVEIDGDTHLNLIKQQLTAKKFRCHVDNLVMADLHAESDLNTYVLYAHNLDYHAQPNPERLFAEPLDAKTLRTALARELPDYMLPAQSHFIAAMPIMGNGKTDTQALKALVIRTEPEELVFQQPLDPLEASVFDIWRQILRKERLAVHTSFFESGGNSMDIVALHGRLLQEFGCQFSVIELFRNTTINQQANLIRHLQSSSAQAAQNHAEVNISAEARRNRRRNIGHVSA